MFKNFELAGLFGGLILVTIWGWLYTENLSAGLNKVFYEEYRWESFVIGVLGSGLISFGLAEIRMRFVSQKKENLLSMYIFIRK